MNRLAADLDLSAIRLIKPRYQIKRSCLAAAVSSENTVDLAFSDCKRKITDNIVVIFIISEISKFKSFIK